MLSDEQRVALNVALEKFIAEKNAHDGVVNPVTLYSEAMFAAGIAYAQTWRGMESAPKDGTAVLLSNAGGSWIARYEPVYPSGYRPENPWFSLMLNRDYIKVGKYAPPTHWMPLPLPPTEAK